MIIAGVVFGFVKLSDPTTLPIKSVQIEGTFKYLDVVQVQHVVSRYADRGFLNLDIQDIQNEVKTIGWVDQVSVRRVWPDTVRIRVKEHAPIARWKNDGLVNERGEWFGAGQGELVKMLPEFSGPEGYSLKLMEHYQKFDQMLEPAGLEIANLTLDQRRTWGIKLENGIEIRLGKENADLRLRRFVRVYPLLLAQLSAGLSLESKSSIEGLTSKVGGIDLRYTNGFAIRWQREKKSDLLNRGTQKNV
jgi:cell division protein FtsQ